MISLSGLLICLSVQSCYWEFVQRSFWKIQDNQKSLICQTPPGLHSIRYMLVSVSLTRCPYITLSPSLFGKKYWQKNCLHNLTAQIGKYSYPTCNRKKDNTNSNSTLKEVVLYVIHRTLCQIECASNQVHEFLDIGEKALLINEIHTKPTHFSGNNNKLLMNTTFLAEIHNNIAMKA